MWTRAMRRAGLIMAVCGLTLQFPRVDSATLSQALWTRLPLVARGLRRVPQAGTLTLVWPDQKQRVLVVGRGQRHGLPGELLLWLSGRTAAALVQLAGTDALLVALRDTPLRM